MGIGGVSSTLNSIGAQYDFTKMTNAQFLSAVQELGKDGKISQSDTDQLSAIAQGVDSVPVNGNSSSVSNILSDPTQKNWMADLQIESDSAHSLAGSIGSGLYDSMLKDLQTYQGNSMEDTANRISAEV